MQSLLHCYCAEAGYYWSNQLDMIEFRYNSFPSENTSTLLHPFEPSYEYQSAAPVDRIDGAF